ncbi:SusC/RagA family TonB-linked outer membrane protein [Arcticibacterium luteifluviistationis]|uniref:SusC/RagA family TonB-linked outer membrane protein n=1 Tax=Arcticibacterium luteifluviistationis TaxID=1784714 RepID=A0A2Z4GB88_9BACT|nr:TonB-dependent receptor [Arcticibacterium luteifluviistationis]AWV98391.1 SusC/RagA family TonB-linked outer membrane protein [Arcticibacterium luteifluviistationis]
MKLTFLQKKRSLLKQTVLLILALGISTLSHAIDRKVSGTVSASEDGTPMVGVSVTVKGSTNGTITDINGKYNLNTPDNGTLVFSFIGYTTKEVAIGNQTLIDISLDTDSEALDEIIVVGYGTQKKSHSTGAISRVVNDDLDQIAVARVDDALVGQVSGVNIQATDGEAGAAPTITIRGVGSLSGDSQPLVVVDGVIVSSDFLGSLNMNDIASFEVLKDAASSSIYGSKGANGIIMITTKSGGDGKPTISYNAFTGVKEARHSDAYTFSIAETAAAELAANGVVSDQTKYKQAIGVDRSWQDVIFDGGNINSHALSFRGGNKATSFSVGFNYLNDEGVLLTDNFTKYAINLKLDTKINDKISFGANLSPSKTVRRRFDGSTHDILRQTNWLPVYHDASTIGFVDRNVYPDVQIGDYAVQRHFDNYDFNGDGGQVDISNTSNTNPAAKVLEKERYDNKFKIFGSIYGDYKITDHLSFRTTFSSSFQDTRRSRWEGSLSSRNGASDASMSEGVESELYLISDNFLSYNNTFGKSDVSGVLGFVGENRNFFVSSMSGSGYSNDLVKNISNATVINSATAFDWKKTGMSFVSRINYAYDDRFLASVSLRRDGSSIFGQDYKFGNFPAASIGWNLANEDFLKRSKIISNLKFRASFGVTGNDFLNTGSVDSDRSTGGSISTGNVLVDYYPSLALLGATTAIVDGAIVGGFNPANIANAELQWERLVEFNPGLDFGLFNNRVTGSIDYYQRNSSQLLLNNPVSVTTGFNSALVNLGKVKNEGLEFELRTRNFVGNKFKWSTTVIATTNKNTLVDFADSDGQITSVDSKRASEWINLVGQPISTFYGYVVDKDIPLEYLKNAYHPVGGEAQDVYVKDLNNDGVINDDDKRALGDPYPDFIWSLTNSFNYGNFDFSFMLQGSHGAKVRNMGDQYLFNQFNSRQDFEPETTPNQEFIQQKIFTDDIVQDASYVALRNVNIGYTLPASLLTKFKINTLRVYVSGQNLFYKTASDYTGFNPESIDRTGPTTYGYQRAGSPIYSTKSIGLSLNF